MRRQRGNIILYGIIALFVATLAAGVVYTYQSAIAEAEKEAARADKAEADNKTLREVNSEALTENQNLRMLKQRQDLILAERQGQRNAAAKLEGTIDAALSKAMQQSEVRRWADTPVPQSVADSVRNDAAGGRASAKDRGVPAGPKPAAASPGR